MANSCPECWIKCNPLYRNAIYYEVAPLSTADGHLTLNLKMIVILLLEYNSTIVQLATKSLLLRLVCSLGTCMDT